MPNNSFADLFETQQQHRPERAGRIRIGERVEGVVTQVTSATVFVELPGNRQGYLDCAEFLKLNAGLRSFMVPSAPPAAPPEAASSSTGTSHDAVARVEDRPRFDDAATTHPHVLKRRALRAISSDATHDRELADAGVVHVTGGAAPSPELAALSAHPSHAANPFGAATNPPAQVGQKISAYVLAVEQDGSLVKLGFRVGEGGISTETLEAAKAQRMPVEGKVTGVNKGGLEVLVGGMRAFCPSSQVDVVFTEDLNRFIGQTHEFCVTEVSEAGKKIVLSRRLHLESRKVQQQEQTLLALRVGAIVRGEITNVREFGAFVDLGGLDGLIPARELSYERGAKPADVVKPGDIVEVQVLEVQREGKRSQVTLSLKALSADPWQNLATLAPTGRVFAGQVTSATDFGVFVRIASGIEGLLHRSELPPGKPVPKIGDQLMVVASRVEPEKRKLSLTLAPDGVSVGSVASRRSLVVGEVVRGNVTSVEQHGVFIQVEGTADRSGRGFIPTAELGVGHGVDLRKKFPVGAPIEAKVIEAGKRLRLSCHKLEEDRERADFDTYRSETASQNSFGTLADVLSKRNGH